MLLSHHDAAVVDGLVAEITRLKEAEVRFVEERRTLAKRVDKLTAELTMVKLLLAEEMAEREKLEFRRGELQPPPVKRGLDRATVKNALTGHRVLMVEDQEINQMVLREILEQVGVQVTAAGNGREALTVMSREEGRFDSVLMDLQMPELDGYEATRLIRKQWPADRLPIIALTAHAGQEDRYHCLQAGMNDHLTKPVNPEQIYECLLKWM